MDVGCYKGAEGLQQTRSISSQTFLEDKALAVCWFTLKYIVPSCSERNICKLTDAQGLITVYGANWLLLDFKMDLGWEELTWDSTVT